MEKIISAVICGQAQLLLYTKLLADGKKKYFVVNANSPETPGGHEISYINYKKSIEKHDHIVFLVDNDTKYRALMIEGLDIPWEPLFDLFLFEMKIEKIFQTLVGLNEKIDHYELLEVEKAFYSDPGLYVNIRNKLEYWAEDHSLPINVIASVEKICQQHGYIKLEQLLKYLTNKALV